MLGGKTMQDIQACFMTFFVFLVVPMFGTALLRKYVTFFYSCHSITKELKLRETCRVLT